MKPETADLLTEIADKLEAPADFSEAEIKAAIEGICEARGLGLGKVAQPIRVALTGNTVSPGIFETLELLGRERSLARIRKAAEAGRT
ncbi:MAG: hypothetical protein M5R36_02030 [Deltaproteobacteria bacterium]|nr:hypothetical protein [Deltaproteobacteria bacterium]